VAKSAEDTLNDKVGAAAAAALDVAGPDLVSLTIDFQASGECPYRMSVAGEILPLIGLAGVPPERFTGASDRTPVAQSHDGGE